MRGRARHRVAIGDRQRGSLNLDAAARRVDPPYRDPHRVAAVEAQLMKLTRATQAAAVEGGDRLLRAAAGSVAQAELHGGIGDRPRSAVEQHAGAEIVLVARHAQQRRVHGAVLVDGGLQIREAHALAAELLAALDEQAAGLDHGRRRRCRCTRAHGQGDVVRTGVLGQEVVGGHEAQLRFVLELRPGGDDVLCLLGAHLLDLLPAWEELETAQIVQGERQIGEALVDDQRIALVSATGSTAMGRSVGPRVAQRFGQWHGY